MRIRRVGSAALLGTMMAFVAYGAIGAAAQQSEAEPWIHVAVTGGDGENLNLNLPLAAIEAFVNLMPESLVRDGEVQIGERGLPIAAIRGMWVELRDVGDVEFATIEADGSDLRIAREGETILISVTDTDDETGTEQMRVEIPVPVVDALLSGEGATLNIGAAVEELSSLRGEMVRVVDADSNIRIWIDESPAQ